ncbi:MAG: hypothetical protein V3S37_07015, partial [Dehalococcoidia bacterium]
MALAQRKTQKSLPDMLLEAGLVTKDQIQQALEEQERTGGRLEEILAQQELVTPDQLAIFTSLQLGVPFVNLKTQPFESRALDLLTEELCRKYGVVPLQVTGESVVMATDDPSNIQILDELSAHLKKRIEPVLALRQDIQDALDRNYRVSGEIERQLTHLSAQSTGAALGQEQALSVEAIAQAPVVLALDLLIRQASRDRASDVHIEPQETHLRIRFRIDG